MKSKSKPGLLLPEMVHIPAGPFTMGSTEQHVAAIGMGSGLEEWFNNELPQHTVNLQAYAIGKYPVTNAEYQAFVRSSGREAPRGWEGEEFPEGKANHPVVLVTWQDAVVYCRWLQQQTGDVYMLPSEAEWEKAARGSADARIYPWGDLFKMHSCNTKEARIGHTVPVGQYSPQGDSPYGCVDMSGNVWEWTRSHLKDYPYSYQDGREDLEAGDDVARVMRGGSFLDLQADARVSFRIRLDPYLRNFDLGFRVALPARLKAA